MEESLILKSKDIFAALKDLSASEIEQVLDQAAIMLEEERGLG